MKSASTTKIVDLPSEILQHILLIVAISSQDGLATIAKFMCTCKLFREVASSAENLKALPFKGSSPFINKPEFWDQAALLIKSVHAGNPSAIAVTRNRIDITLTSANIQLAGARQVFEDAVSRLNLGGTSEDLLIKLHILAEIRGIITSANWDILWAEEIRERAGL